MLQVVDKIMFGMIVYIFSEIFVANWGKFYFDIYLFFSFGRG